MIRSKATQGLTLPLPHSEKYSSMYFGERCCICNEEQPVDKNVLRHEDTDNIICMTCLNTIAEMN